MDIIESIYSWMVGTPPMRALAAGIIAMLVVQAVKPWLSETLYKPVAGAVALVVCLLLEVAVATPTSPVTPQGLILAALAGMVGGFVAPGLYELLKDIPGLKTLMKRA